MKSNWDEAFPGIVLNVSGEVSLRSTGGLTKPIVPGGAAQ